jgi:selenocysteine-specific elongation factor
MFTLDKYLITLVDAPGHSDLIRSVVAGANIIDAAILTVAADEGPKVQTGEHLIVLESLGIDLLLIAITKIDLANEKQISAVEAKMQTLLKDAHFKEVIYSRVSAFENIGIAELREALHGLLHPPERNITGKFLMPIDHAFSIKGHGTVVTGTILRGQLQTNNRLELMPQGWSGKIRSIQTFSQERASAQAGDRVGLNIPELNHHEIYRGDYLCESHTLQKATNVLVSVKKNPLYSGRITKKMTLSTMIGMPDVTAQIIPITTSRDAKMIIDEIKDDSFSAVLLLSKPIAVERGMKVIMMRTDLSPTSMRIVGSGVVETILDEVILYRKTTRKGRISRIRDNDVLVEGLTSRKDLAEKLRGKQIQTLDGSIGLLGIPFGTKGVLTAVFKGKVNEGDTVVHEFLTRPEVYKFGV